MRRRWGRVAAAIAVSAGLIGCGGGGHAGYLVELPRRGRPLSPDPTVSTVAEARTSPVPVFAQPGAGAPALELAHPTESGAPRVFLAISYQGEWIEVLLPVRPNGSTGWIRQADVVLTQHAYRVKVEVGERRISVWDGNEMVMREPVGVGKRRTPTPDGVYYLTELLQPPKPDGLYGAYAFGISGYSNVLNRYRGGDGGVGIHGTNDPDTIGEEVSHGCIRLTNDAITRLAEMLPLGTPVFISP